MAQSRTTSMEYGAGLLPSRFGREGFLSVKKPSLLFIRPMIGVIICGVRSSLSLIIASARRKARSNLCLQVRIATS